LLAPVLDLQCSAKPYLSSQASIAAWPCRKLAPIALALVAGGCGWGFYDFPYEQVEGRAIRSELVSQIKDGETTEADLQVWFGDPSFQVGSDSGPSRTLRYLSVRTAVSVDKKPFVEHVTERTLREELTVEVEGKRVKSHRFVSSTSSRRLK
jgi:hypothetical protein